MGHGKRPFDYGMAEALAFGSLLMEGMPVRFSGQDSRRGTFNQRQPCLIDIENEQNMFRSPTSRPTRQGLKSTTRSFRKRPCWDSSTATAAIIPRLW